MEQKKSHQKNSSQFGTKRRSTRDILKNDVAEFLLGRTAKGKLYYRVGEILRVPKVQGKTILLCDYDGCQRPSTKRIRQRLAGCGVHLLRSRIFRSPSRKGWHAVLLIRGEYQKFAVIALQSILESDPEREAQNFFRAQVLDEKTWRTKGNVLFTNQK